MATDGDVVRSREPVTHITRHCSAPSAAPWYWCVSLDDSTRHCEYGYQVVANGCARTRAKARRAVAEAKPRVEAAWRVLTGDGSALDQMIAAYINGEDVQPCPR